MLNSGRKICHNFAHVLRFLWETEIKGSGFINLAEETSKQPNVQAMACVLLVIFIHIYSEKSRTKADVKSFQLYQKRNAYKVKVNGGQG